MKTSELTGAQLDYWTARAEGVPAEQLNIRRVPRTDKLIVVRKRNAWDASRVLPYSTDWAQGGPLIEKYKMDAESPDYAHSPWIFSVYSERLRARVFGHGSAPLQAICRAVVRAAFGDEVEEVGVCD